MRRSEGKAGLLDRRIGKASGRRMPVDRCDEVERLYPTRSGFHRGGISTSNLLPTAERRGAHRRKRPRRPLPGMMLHHRDATRRRQARQRRARRLTACVTGRGAAARSGGADGRRDKARFIRRCLSRK